METLIILRKKKSDEGPKTLFDYILLNKNAKLKHTDKGQFTIELASGTKINYFGSAQQPDTFDLVGKDSDQALMSYSNGQWLCPYTQQEQVRRVSFSAQLNRAEEHYLATSKVEQALQSKSKIDMII